MEQSQAFSGNGVFTSADPLAALSLAGVVQWVAVRPDLATPEEIQKLKEAGFEIVIWEAQASEAGVAAIQQYGATGYIAQAEGPSQLEAAQAVSDQINVPKALVTNNFMDTWPPGGWIAMPEAYQNSNPNATPERVVDDARRKGAQQVVPVVGAYNASGEGGGVVSMNDYLAGVERSGTGNFAAFSAEELSPEDRAALSAASSTKPPSWTPDAEQLANDYLPLSPEPPRPHPPDALDRGLKNPSPKSAPPPPYTGGAGGEEWLEEHPEKTWVYTDKLGRKITRTVTASGAIIDQVEGGTPFRVSRGTEDPAGPAISNPDAADRNIAQSEPLGPVASDHGAQGFDRANELSPETINGNNATAPPGVSSSTESTQSPLNHFGLYDQDVELGNKFRAE